MSKKLALSLFLICSAVQSNELDNLINSSAEISQQLDLGVMLVGSALEYSSQGTGLSDGNLSTSAHITQQQVQAYNDALLSMENYLPYGSVQTVLENRASESLQLMDEAVDVFTEAVVEIAQVQQVAEMSEQASTPDEEKQVQDFVVENQETLTISQDTVDDYNQSLDDIETHANTASAYIAVAANADAVEFLQTGAENNNTTAELATVAYNANQQWVAMSWAGTNNATAVYLNGQNFGLDLYLSETDILTAGSESEFYNTSPMALGYECFFNYEDC